MTCQSGNGCPLVPLISGLRLHLGGRGAGAYVPLNRIPKPDGDGLANG